MRDTFSLFMIIAISGIMGAFIGGEHGFEKGYISGYEKGSADATALAVKHCSTVCQERIDDLYLSKVDGTLRECKQSLRED